MGNYIQIDIGTSSPEHSEILIAELSQIDYYSFEEKENFLFAFIKEEDFNEEKLKEIISQKLSYTKTIIPETNWNAKWESEFQPIIVDDFVAVRAAFHKPIPNVQHEIIITPKMSFGTGHHATTYLMLQQMQHLEFTDKSVLDFGTGTGILAILAKKLGAGKVIAIDNDNWSINNAKENILANNCKEINLIKRDTPDFSETFDIVLCNINLNVVVENIGSLKKICHPSTEILISGFLIRHQQKLLDNFVQKDFICKSITQNDNWIAMLLTKC
ncbi:MAG: 50S ribosomal protein L11 methyltransferase [Bacteroidota bacterium]|nr:50S ribosomal protein L11 methyltransferase [Bacteroidota bacterium]